jgi:hypothetical protein
MHAEQRPCRHLHSLTAAASVPTVSEKLRSKPAMQRVPSPDWTEEECRRELDFWWQHPDPTPPDLTNVLCYNPPSIFRSTARFMKLRDDLSRGAKDENTVKKILAVDRILAWRETVPRDRRFWAEDEPDLTGRQRDPIGELA